MLITIIIPTYKSNKTIARCLQSVLNQKYNSYECLIVDYPENTKTKDVVEQYVLKDSRFKYVACPIKGAIAQRSFGIKLAKGDYIAFIDSDDYAHSSLLDTFSSVNSKKQVDLFCFAKIKIEREDIINHLENQPLSGCYNFYNYKDSLRLKKNIRNNISFISMYTKIVRKDIALEACDYYNATNNVTYWEDAIFTYFVVFKSQCIIQSNNILYYSINNTESVTNSLKDYDKYYFDCVKVSSILTSMVTQLNVHFGIHQCSIYAIFGFISSLIETRYTNFASFKKVFITKRKVLKSYIKTKCIFCWEKEYTKSERFLAIAIKYNNPYIAYLLIQRSKKHKQKYFDQ